MSRSQSRRRPAKTKGRARQFIRSLVLSALASFTVASAALNPQLGQELLAPIWALLQPEPAPPTLTVVPGQLAQTSFTSCPVFFPEGRAPQVPAAPALRELCFDAFALLHSGNTRTPVFVAQRLNRRMLQQAQGITRRDRFFADARLPAAERAELNDYRNSGYSRGHMAPAADMHTAAAMEQSFSLANMVPQDASQNSGPWAKIESDTRKYIMRAPGDVYVFTGPVYGTSNQKIGQRVAVPSHLFKVVYDASSRRAWVHWQANHAKAQVGAPISYAEFVRRTGLHLLPG
ncbi:DNA/RNA non-specific endonuclease [Pusillimonas sp. CC-YST705]|uniref:DNA/RNA non-specific endonuclease n=1 Tax=Mesopusillimonas faecipullorum TaxID=2755040 RepID=A0ABS8C830_9BURK|nr:DNA/RNA non-specific endonuclease [Mesopusillimonas faecipullorum]